MRLVVWLQPSGVSRCCQIQSRTSFSKGLSYQDAGGLGVSLRRTSRGCVVAIWNSK